MENRIGTFLWWSFNAAWIAFVLGIGAGILAVLSQLLGWLKTARWRTPIFSDAFGAIHISLPHSTWIGAQKIIDWFQKALDGINQLPLAAVFPLIGIFAALGLLLPGLVIVRLAETLKPKISN